MTAEQDLLRRLRQALATSDLDVEELVTEAWSEARDEVKEVLRRLLTDELLRRATATIEGTEPRPEPASEPSPPPTTSGRVATYLFGVAGDDLSVPDRDLPRLPGGGDLRTVGDGPLRAIVCDIDPAVFELINEPDPESIELLAEAATAHDAVLASLAEAGPVLPLRLGTVVADDDVVSDLLAGNEQQLRAELERVTGHAEWAVTAYLVESAGGSTREEADTAASGRDYLERRRVALEDRENRWELREELAASIHDALSEHAAASARIESRPLEEGPAPLLHGVHLVANDAFADFETALEDLRSRYQPAIIELSGPWPPYHFTAVDLRSGSSGP